MSTCDQDWEAYKAASAAYPAKKAAWDAELANYNSSTVSYQTSMQQYLAALASLKDSNKACTSSQASYEAAKKNYEAQLASYQLAVAAQKQEAANVAAINASKQANYTKVLGVYQGLLAAYNQRVHEHAAWRVKVDSLKAQHDQAWNAIVAKYPTYGLSSYYSYFGCGGHRFYCWPKGKASGCVEVVRGIGFYPGNTQKQATSCMLYNVAMATSASTPNLFCPVCPTEPVLGEKPLPPAPPVLTPLPPPPSPFTLSPPSPPGCSVVSESSAGSAPVPPLAPQNGPSVPAQPQCSVTALIAPSPSPSPSPSRPAPADEPQAYMPANTEQKGIGAMGLWLLLGAGAVGVYFYTRK